MIRFRLGHSWRRGPERALEDAFGLELDGIELLPQVNGESLAIVVPELLEAVSALYTRGEPLGQVSLPEAHLELALWRRGDEVQVTVVDLGRPARICRGPVMVDLVELSSAAVRCARTLMDRLKALAHIRRSAPIQRMMRRMAALEHRPPAALLGRRADFALASPAPPDTPASFRFELGASDHSLAAFGGTGLGALTSLLFDGSVSFAIAPEKTLWRAAGRPFLLTLEICRQATELSRARQLQEPQISLLLGGVGPAFEVDLRREHLSVASVEHPLSPSDLERAMFDLGLSLAYFAFARNSHQRKNPYFRALVERCREGLAQLRAPAAPAEDGQRWREARQRSPHPQVHRSGQLRRLRFTELWKKTRLGSEEPGRILLAAGGPIFSSAPMACAFSRRGELLFRRVCTHGLAVSRDGWVLAASADRLDCFLRSNKSASWTRDHDGRRIGPWLHRRKGLLVGPSGRSSIFALSELSGREIWRLAPTRAREVFSAIQGDRVLIAADSGDLHGLDLKDGQLRYRLRAPAGFAGPPIAWGSKFLALAGRRDRYYLLAADAHRGTLHWSAELDLSSSTLPIALGNRVLVAGERGSDGVLVCLTSTGEPAWERRLHSGAAPFTLRVAGTQIIACSSRGGAVCFSSDGQPTWRLGELSRELLWPCAPAVARGVIFVPGEKVRAVDVSSGEVLAELPAGIGLCDLKTDAKLDIFLLDEDGTLQAHRLASHFAVMAGKPPG